MTNLIAQTFAALSRKSLEAEIMDDNFHLVIEVSDLGLYDALLELFMRRDPTAIVSVNGIKQPLLESYELEVLDEDAAEGILPVVFVTIEKRR